MALEGNAGIGVAHSATVVDHLDEGAPGVAHYNLYVVGAGIDCVFHQFLHYRGWPLDHFTCGYLVGYGVGQESDYVAHSVSESVFRLQSYGFAASRAKEVIYRVLITSCSLNGVPCAYGSSGVSSSFFWVPSRRRRTLFSSPVISGAGGASRIRASISSGITNTSAGFFGRIGSYHLKRSRK